MRYVAFVHCTNVEFEFLPHATGSCPANLSQGIPFHQQGNPSDSGLAPTSRCGSLPQTPSRRLGSMQLHRCTHSCHFSSNASHLIVTATIRRTIELQLRCIQLAVLPPWCYPVVLVLDSCLTHAVQPQVTCSGQLLIRIRQYLRDHRRQRRRPPPPPYLTPFSRYITARNSLETFARSSPSNPSPREVAKTFQPLSSPSSRSCSRIL